MPDSVPLQSYVHHHASNYIIKLFKSTPFHIQSVELRFRNIQVKEHDHQEKRA